MSDDELAGKAASEAVLKELDGRRGCGQELRAIRDEFPDTWRELKKACAKAAADAIAARRTTPGKP